MLADATGTRQRPARPRRRRLAAARRRELILAGAVEVFAGHGYEAASIAEIARAGGVTPAVVYDHFPSKAALAIELLSSQTAELLAFVAGVLTQAPESPEARMRAGVTAFFDYVAEHPFAWRMLFREAPADPRVAAAYSALDRQATRAIAELIKANAGPALALEENPERACEMFAQGIKSAQNGLAAWWYEHPEVAREEIVQRVLELCWGGLARLAAREPKGAA
jgi:AcrR family transcriptional regulator